MDKVYVLNGRLPGANEYINANRQNKYLGAKLKRETEDSIVLQIKAQLLKDKKPKLKPPIDIGIQWFVKDKRRDKDNIIFAKKFIMDALQTAGIIGNDNWAWIDKFEDVVCLSKENGVGENYLTIVTLTEKES